MGALGAESGAESGDGEIASELESGPEIEVLGISSIM